MICATCGRAVTAVTVTPEGVRELPCGHRGVIITAPVEWQPTTWPQRGLDTITWRVSLPPVTGEPSYAA